MPALAREGKLQDLLSRGLCAGCGRFFGATQRIADSEPHALQQVDRSQSGGSNCFARWCSARMLQPFIPWTVYDTEQPQTHLYFMLLGDLDLGLEQVMHAPTLDVTFRRS